jgi:hypothetical protein
MGKKNKVFEQTCKRYLAMECLARVGVMLAYYLRKIAR